MGLYSSFHIAQLQCGLAQPLRLGQARKIKVSYITQLQCGLAQPLRLGQARKIKVSYITQLQCGLAQPFLACPSLSGCARPHCSCVI
jgi:hypothetical protein